MRQVAAYHLEHIRELFFAERARREAIRGSLSTPVAAISFAVFALSSLSIEVDPSRWQESTTLAILVLGVAAVATLFASAYQVVMSEWLFVYHEPPRLSDLLPENADEERRGKAVLAASYAVAYEQYLTGNAASARRRTWALRLILLSLFLQALAFVVLPFQLAGR